MKHLFFAAVTFGIISGTPQLVKAQANVNIEQLSANGKSEPKKAPSPKFIENIQINPLSVSAQVEDKDVALVEKNRPVAETSLSNAALSSIEKFSSLQFKYAMLMDVDVESVSNTDLYNFIEDWWATRYRYGGQDKKGIDCSAFCGKLYSEVYHINLDRMAKDQFKQCEKISDEDLKEGDLVFFNTRGGVSHVGMYLGNKHFVHSSVKSGVTISSLEEDYYSRRFISGGRISK